VTYFHKNEQQIYIKSDFIASFSRNTVACKKDIKSKILIHVVSLHKIEYRPIHHHRKDNNKKDFNKKGHFSFSFDPSYSKIFV